MRSPRSCSRPMALDASWRRGVEMASTPMALLSTSTTTTASPRFRYPSAADSRSTGSGSPKSRTTRTMRSPTRPATPAPGRTATSEARSVGRWAAQMALAIGCSMSASTAAATSRTSSVASPPTGATATTVAIPMVRVPVLSKATVSTAASRSRASAFRMRMPRAEARPQPTIIATGVARPMAHGQATSRTAMALSTAVPRFEAMSHQPRKVAAATSSTIGTNTPLTRSARRSIGAFWVRASSTTCWRRARTDSVATARTSTTRTPSPLRVPPMTRLPGPCSTGRGSPVNIDSSTADQPSTTSPSSGIVSPGGPGHGPRRGPPRVARSGRSVDSTPVRPAAPSGAGARPGSAAPEPPRVRARTSTARPVTRTAMMSGAMAPWSRAAKAPLPPRWRWRPPRAIASTALTASAASVPSVISVSMLVAP